jgi:hypothetical protein
MTYLRKKLADFTFCVLMFFFGSLLLYTGLWNLETTVLDGTTIVLNAVYTTMTGLGATTVLFSSVVGFFTLVRVAYHLISE